MDTNVRMPANHTRCGTGCIQENPIKRPTIPPGFDITRVGLDYSCIEPQTRKGLHETLNSSPILFESPDFKRLALFQDMRRLATRCRAGIEDTHARPKIQKACGKLRCGVLYGDTTFIKPRQAGNIAGPLKHQGLRSNGVSSRIHPCLAQFLQIRFNRLSALIDTQDHGGTLVACSTDIRPCLGVGML